MKKLRTQIREVKGFKPRLGTGKNKPEELIVIQITLKFKGLEQLWLAQCITEANLKPNSNNSLCGLKLCPSQG